MNEQSRQTSVQLIVTAENMCRYPTCRYSHAYEELQGLIQQVRTRNHNQRPDLQNILWKILSLAHVFPKFILSLS